MIDASRDDSVATTEAQERLKEVFELCEAAEILVRESLRRRLPNAGENEIERRVGEWRLGTPRRPARRRLRSPRPSPPMIPLAAALHQLDADLGTAGRSWALVGGLAVAARATPAHLSSRVEGAVTDSTAEAAAAIGKGFAELGYRSVPVTARSQAAGARILNLISPAPQMRTVFVDLLLAVSGIEPDLVAAADRITVLGRQIPVAKLGHLLALKLLANRPQDQMDGARLILAASDAEMRRAREALDLIAERGFARDDGRDLQAELTRWIERAPEIA